MLRLSYKLFVNRIILGWIAFICASLFDKYCMLTYCSPQLSTFFLCEVNIQSNIQNKRDSLQPSLTHAYTDIPKHTPSSLSPSRPYYTHFRQTHELLIISATGVLAKCCLDAIGIYNLQTTELDYKFEHVCISIDK